MTPSVHTCTFLWLAADDSSPSTAARSSWVSREDQVHRSALSAWEIAVKYRLGRIPLPLAPRVYGESRREWLGLAPLAREENCTVHDARLPPLRRDPIDRGLVAQAILHGMTIVTPDPAIHAYPVRTLW